MPWKKGFKGLLALLLFCLLLFIPAVAARAIDNSALDQPGFRQHKTAYGLVYRLPDDVVAKIPQRWA